MGWQDWLGGSELRFGQCSFGFLLGEDLLEDPNERAGIRAVSLRTTTGEPNFLPIFQVGNPPNK